MEDIYVATSGGTIVHNGRQHVIRKGVTTVRAGHPILDVWGDRFTRLKVHFDLDDVEQATAAPGEKRNVNLPPQPPPKSGPGSGVEAWREHAARVTGEPVESFADMSRDEIVELVKPGGDH